VNGTSCSFEMKCRGSHWVVVGNMFEKCLGGK